MGLAVGVDGQYVSRHIRTRSPQPHTVPLQVTVTKHQTHTRLNTRHSTLPHTFMVSRAVDLSPMSRICCGLGPMNSRP